MVHVVINCLTHTIIVLVLQFKSSERAALFYLEYGNNGQARKYLEKSRDLYQAWGAHRKVEDVCSLLATIQ